MGPSGFSLEGRKVAVAGHRGMVGAALVRRLEQEGCELVGLGRDEADLRRQSEVECWFDRERPQVLFLAAAKVGGIAANDALPADFLYDNLMIEAHAIETAHRFGVAKLIFLGSSCIYPKLAPQPIAEEALLTGPLEPTNEWYAIAKIAGIKLCQAYRRQHGRDFISAQPTNLYGPGDNYDLESSHVLPALIRKAHEAKLAGAANLTIWGSGRPQREFLHVDDLADALVFLARNYSGEAPINIGSGEELTIRELAELVAEVVGFEGSILLDPGKPDGTPRKRLDTSKLDAMGWRAKTPLRAGIEHAYRDFLTGEALRGARVSALAAH